MIMPSVLILGSQPSIKKKISKGDKQLVESTTSQLKKIIKNMQLIIKQLHEKIVLLQGELETNKKRACKRQAQFLGIIQKYRIQEQILLDNNPEIDKMFKKIMNNFDQFNIKTAEIIEQKYEQSMQMMDTQIKQIENAAEKAMSKVLTSIWKDPANLHEEMRILYQTVRKIEKKNFEIMDMIKKVEDENQLLKSQRQLLIGDAIDKKFRADKLTNELKHMKKQFGLILKTTQTSQYQNTNKCSTKESKNFIYTTKNSLEIDSKSDKRKNRSIVQKNLTARSQFYSKNISVDSEYRNDRKQTIIKNVIFIPKYEKSYSPLIGQTKKRRVSAFTNECKSSQKYLKFQTQRQSLQLKKNETQYWKTKEHSIESQGNKQKQKKQQCNERVITNLQKNLKREKKKMNTLGSIITELNGKNKQINLLIQKIMEQFDQTDGKIQSQYFIEKMIKTFKFIKRELNGPKYQRLPNEVPQYFFDL